MDTCDSNYNPWLNVYFTQLFTTLGQLTAVILSSSVAVPVFNYYSRNLKLTFRKSH